MKQGLSITSLKQVFTHRYLDAQQLLEGLLQITDREGTDRIWKPLVNENFDHMMSFQKGF